MIKFENTEVMGWEHAIRGMRNPLNSWERSDSGYGCNLYGDRMCCQDCEVVNKSDCINKRSFSIGPNDLDLMKRLRNAGTDHRKFMRMIVVYTDITAPLYWWKEFDTYRTGVTPNPMDIEMNSCSTMHKIAAKKFTLDDFSHEHLTVDWETVNDGVTCTTESTNWKETLEETIFMLNIAREKYLKTKCKKYWWQMIQLLPSSYNQKRTVMLNYEVLANIYKSRKDHKLNEWRENIPDENRLDYGEENLGFCDWITTLPYSELITGDFEKEE